MSATPMSLISQSLPCSTACYREVRCSAKMVYAKQLPEFGAEECWSLLIRNTPILKLKLISIGLVGEDGQKQFYAEVPVNEDECNRFVRENVPSVLTGPVMELQELRQALLEWFKGMPRKVVLAADSPIDIRLLMDFASWGTALECHTGLVRFETVD